MTFSTCPYWSKTSQERGKQIKRQQSSQNSKLAAITRSTRWRVFATVRFTPQSWKRAIYQDSTIQYPRKTTSKTKAPENLHQQCTTSRNQLAPSIKTTSINQQQPFHPQIWPHQWPNALPCLMLTESGSAVNSFVACRKRQSIILLLTNQSQNSGSVFFSFFSFSVDQGFWVFH